MNRQILLKSRPAGEPTPANFEAADAPVPEPKEGEVLRRTIYLSLDPYMRGRMSDAASYATPVKIGDSVKVRAVAPKLGEHNAEIYEKLGYGAADLAALREKSVI